MLLVDGAGVAYYKLTRPPFSGVVAGPWVGFVTGLDVSLSDWAG